MVKPTNTDELKAWLAEHSLDGMIGGEPVVKPGRVEFRGGILQGDLYDLLILRGAAFSYTKSDLIQHAFILLLERTYSFPVNLTKPDVSQARSEYRGYLAASFHEMVMKLKEKLGFNNSELLTLAGEVFVNDPFVFAKYRNFVNNLIARYGCTEAEIEQAVYDHARLKAREKRLILSNEKGEFVADTKIAT